MRRPAHGPRLAPLVGVLLVLLMVVAVWPAADSEAESPPDQAQAARSTATRTPVRTPTRTPVGGAKANTNPNRQAVLPFVGRDSSPTPTSTPTATPTPVPQPLTAMAVGAGVIDNNFEMVQAMGFPWIKLNVDWGSNPDPSGLIDQARQRYPGVKILLRIDDTPAGARTGNNADPIDAAQLDAFLRNLAARQRGKVQAYELFNEPNLKWEWNTHIAGGGGYPSVAGYVRILQIAYPAIKAGDPGALVITGGVSSAGGGGGEAIGDLNFISEMYSKGAAGSFDAIGTHPYGGACTYDAGGCSEDIYFRRVELQHDRMLAAGDHTHQMWATELGWLVDPRVYGKPECMPGLGGRQFWVRSPADVANQLVLAYRHAAAYWPWMGGMFFFNFDYSAAGWVQGYDRVCDAPSWYSIASKGNMAPRPYTEPAYDALLQFARDYRLTSR